MVIESVIRCMRGGRLGLILAGLVALAPLMDAQQAPEYGCRMAMSCRPSGFSMLNKERGVGGQVGFGLGFHWGPGFEVFVPGSENLTVFPRPTPNADGQVFHLGTSLLAPAPPTPTLPLVTLPMPIPTSEDPPKN